MKTMDIDNPFDWSVLNTPSDALKEKSKERVAALKEELDDRMFHINRILDQIEEDLKTDNDMELEKKKEELLNEYVSCFLDLYMLETLPS
jgi:hypothetical protein